MKKLIILIVAGVLLLVGITVGVTVMLVGGSDEPAATEDSEEVVEEERGDPYYVDLKPAFTVNLDPQDPVQFLQISIQVLTFDSDVADDIRLANADTGSNPDPVGHGRFGGLCRDLRHQGFGTGDGGGGCANAIHADPLGHVLWVRGI